MAYATNGGVKIHYEVEGSGPPLVLQHGFSYNLEHWRQAGYVEALRRDRRLVLIDARGHGRSDKPHVPSAYTNENHVGDILAVLDAEGIGACDYMGFSMGGWIGFGLATTHPGRVRSIVITGQQPYGRPTPQNVPDGRDVPAYFSWFFQRIGLEFNKLSPEAQKPFLANDCIALAAAQTGRPSLEARLANMTMPCLLMVGDNEPSYEQARKCVPSIPDCTFVVMPGFDHGETFDRSDVVLPHVKRFLQRVEGK
jgi:pimeloyl-ACP methyl ester carboxylesterase